MHSFNCLATLHVDADFILEIEYVLIIFPCHSFHHSHPFTVLLCPVWYPWSTWGNAFRILARLCPVGLHLGGHSPSSFQYLPCLHRASLSFAASLLPWTQTLLGAILFSPTVQWDLVTLLPSPSSRGPVGDDFPLLPASECLTTLTASLKPAHTPIVSSLRCLCSVSEGGFCCLILQVISKLLFW